MTERNETETRRRLGLMTIGELRDKCDADERRRKAAGTWVDIEWMAPEGDAYEALRKACLHNGLENQSAYDQDLFWQYMEHLIHEILADPDKWTSDKALEKMRSIQADLHERDTGYMPPWPDSVTPL